MWSCHLLHFAHKIVQARHVAEGVTVKGYYPVRWCAVPIFLVQPPYTTSGWVQSLDTWWLTWRNTWHVSTPPLNTGWHDVISPNVTRVNPGRVWSDPPCVNPSTLHLVTWRNITTRDTCQHLQKHPQLSQYMALISSLSYVYVRHPYDLSTIGKLQWSNIWSKFDKRIIKI